LANRRRKETRVGINEWSVVELTPVHETEEDFQKRIDEVQEIIVRMVANSKKRGRPSKQEWEDEYAA